MVRERLSVTQSAASSETIIIGQRYRLLQKLGEGGMGAVYRAADRLTGQIVALKRLHFAPNSLMFASRPPITPNTTDDATAMRVALAREFQTLASLRHPRIINVLDYGFEDDETSPDRAAPYFTMTLLENAHPLSIAAARRDMHGKIALIIQMLQALAYLHRRGVIHRDLKPGNALVTRDGVKVLDFGLAIEGRDQSGEIAGTPRYWSPELLQGDGASVASDLYAVGVIAHEMFTGKAIFDDSSIHRLAHEIMTVKPDMSAIPTELSLPFATLLDKKPHARYPSADATIAALCAALDLPIPSEPAAIRESFLQAATFVGRGDEMRTLKRALHDAESGRGSAWLIGGESGVGKSRLIEELRTIALVNGCTVVRGQLIAEGKLPFHGWRDAARHLALDSTIADSEAGVLKTIVPDIETLLGRPIPDVPSAGTLKDMVRLVETLTTICRRPRVHPLVIIMEDLHWADETLAVLGQLSDVLKHELLSVLIISTYRDDERPDIPDILPSMKRMHLNRLDKNGIAQLVASMVGEDAITSALLDLLERETEGNIFFLVETIRALAESAGRLSDVGHAPLSDTIFAAGGHAPGMLAILRRRVERVDEDARAWLKLAAVAGRQIDPALIARLGLTDVDGWLTACVNVAILDVADGVWRFSHDKLRDAVLADLSDAERPTLHRRVVEALEALYADDLAIAPRRLGHWRAAGDMWRAAEATLDSAEYWFNLARYFEVRALCEETLAMLPPPTTDNQRKTRALINMYRGYTYEPLGEYAAGIAIILESLADFTAINARSNMAACYNALGAFSEQMGDRAAARAYFLKGVELRRQDTDYPLGLATALGNLAIYYDLHGEIDQALANYDESITICAANNLRQQWSYNLINRGKLHLRALQLDAAFADASAGVALAREIGLERGITSGLITLSEWALTHGDLNAAARDADESLKVAIQIGDQQSIIDVSITQARIAERRGAFQDGIAAAEYAAATAASIASPRQVIEAQLAAGFLQLSAHDSAKTNAERTAHIHAARAIFKEAFARSEKAHITMLGLLALCGIARLRLIDGDVSGCRRMVARIVEHPRSGEREIRARIEHLHLLLADAPPDSGDSTQTSTGDHAVIPPERP
jgi:tetratricopeptide (TPR) repeat protein